MNLIVKVTKIWEKKIISSQMYLYLCNVGLFQDDILKMKEIAGLVTTCKSLATAYHTSIIFARDIHEAQIKVCCMLWPIILYIHIIIFFKFFYAKG